MITFQNNYVVYQIIDLSPITGITFQWTALLYRERYIAYVPKHCCRSCLLCHYCCDKFINIICSILHNYPLLIYNLHIFLTTQTTLGIHVSVTRLSVVLKIIFLFLTFHQMWKPLLFIDRNAFGGPVPILYALHQGCTNGGPPKYNS